MSLPAARVWLGHHQRNYSRMRMGSLSRTVQYCSRRFL